MRRKIINYVKLVGSGGMQEAAEAPFCCRNLNDWPDIHFWEKHEIPGCILVIC